jgi:predicted nucleic acid-binding protein
VADTNVLIYYFDKVFHQTVRLSPRAKKVMDYALATYLTDVKLSIPSIVFIEIFEKWIRNEEFAKELFYELFVPITRSPNIEIRPLDREVLENLIRIDGTLNNHEMHDKIILASAITLQCPLITTDPCIIEYVRNSHIIPATLN